MEEELKNLICLFIFLILSYIAAEEHDDSF